MHTEEQKHLWQKIERKRLSFEGWAVRRVRSSLRESLKRVIEDVRISPQTALSRLEEDVTTAPIGEAIEDIFLRVGTDFAEQVQRSFTKSVLRDYWIEKMRLLAEDRKAVVMVGIGEESKRSIRNAIAKGVEAGEGQNEIIGRIRDSYAMNNARARMIARTEIVAASNQGALVGAQSAGIPLKKEWIATLDERTRVDHLEMNGTIIEMNENFMVAGEQMSAPADWQFGASAWNVINCRCAVAFVTADDVSEEPEPVFEPVSVSGLENNEEMRKLADDIVRELKLSGKISVVGKKIKGNTAGSVSWVKQPDGSYIMGREVTLNKNTTRLMQKLTLRHEMRHIYQSDAKGFRVALDNVTQKNYIFFEGKKVISVSEYNKILKQVNSRSHSVRSQAIKRYVNFPWEIDADEFMNAVTKSLINGYMTDLIELPEELQDE